MKQNKKELFKEIIRFLIVGGIATLGDYIIFYLCNLLIFKSLNESLNLTLSTALGFITGLLINWFLQSFVFKYVGKDQTRSKLVFLKFVLISVIGLGITELGMLISRPIYSKLIIDVFGLFKFDFWKLFMKCLMTLIVLVWNYFGRKLFVFKQKEEV